MFCFIMMFCLLSLHFYQESDHIYLFKNKIPTWINCDTFKLTTLLEEKLLAYFKP